MAEQIPLKNWPARFRSVQVQVFESEDLQFWWRTADVRRAVPSLRKDAQLLREYPHGIVTLGRGNELFFDEPSLLAELRRNRGSDALQFLAWLDKTVLYPAGRKRAERQLARTAARRSPLPQPRRVADARSPRPTLRPAPVACWRGELSLRATFFGAGLLAVLHVLLCAWVMGQVAHPADYQGDYIGRVWTLVLMIPVILLGPLWWCVGLMRCALRYNREQRGLLLPLASFLLGILVLLQSGAIGLWLGDEWLLGWRDVITGREERVRVSHDPVLGRMVLRGPIGMGSYKVLRAALDTEPRLPLIQLESPGGYVIEGLAMARLIASRQLDTLSLEDCASACTLLLAAGSERYVGPEAEIGFHRSGARGIAPSTGWGSTDHKIAAYYRERGTAEFFVQKALDTPSNDLWVASPELMLRAGYATHLWSERKPGY